MRHAASQAACNMRNTCRTRKRTGRAHSRIAPITQRNAHCTHVAARQPRVAADERDRPWALGVGNGCACSAGWGSGSGALGGVVEGGRDDPYEDRAACIDETAKSTTVKRVDWSMVYGTDLERRINTLASIGNRSRSLQVLWAYRVLSGGRGFNSYRWTLESFLATASPQKL